MFGKAKNHRCFDLMSIREPTGDRVGLPVPISSSGSDAMLGVDNDVEQKARHFKRKRGLTGPV